MIVFERRIATSTVAAALLVLTLAGCDVDSARTPLSTTPSAPVEIPSPTRALPSEDAAASGRASPPDFSGQATEDAAAGRVGNWPVTQPSDSGIAPGAEGDVIVDAEGVPRSYVVAPGDRMELISRRFGLEYGYLIAINQVRRNSLDVFVGDTLNLDASRIESVGDQNGQVYQNPPPYPMPSQY